jgi:hypothetical protein
MPITVNTVDANGFGTWYLKLREQKSVSPSASTGWSWFLNPTINLPFGDGLYNLFACDSGDGLLLGLPHWITIHPDPLWASSLRNPLNPLQRIRLNPVSQHRTISLWALLLTSGRSISESSTLHVRLWVCPKWWLWLLIATLLESIKRGNGKFICCSFCTIMSFDPDHTAWTDNYFQME